MYPSFEHLLTRVDFLFRIRSNKAVKSNAGVASGFGGAGNLSRRFFGQISVECVVTGAACGVKHKEESSGEHLLVLHAVVRAGCVALALDTMHLLLALLRAAIVYDFNKRHTHERTLEILAVHPRSLPSRVRHTGLNVLCKVDSRSIGSTIVLVAQAGTQNAVPVARGRPMESKEASPILCKK